MAAESIEMENVGQGDNVVDTEETAGNEEPVDTHSDYKLGKPGFTGYFRDGKRRIDLVLMFAESKPGSKVETVMGTFFRNTLQMGLAIELEEGLEKIDYGFAKIHAPDSVLDEYAGKVNMRKYFKRPHLGLAKGAVKCEIEMVETTRQESPGHFSTFERSRLVYRMLMPVAFGGSASFVGLHTLLKNNIILDAYPVHDGPYFLEPGQKPEEIQGRQALFYSWVGLRHLYKSQPVHLIQEYLGERVAYFFAFYEHYNRALVILAVFGVLAFLGGFYDDDSAINNAACTKYSHEFSKWYSLWITATYTVTQTYTHIYERGQNRIYCYDDKYCWKITKYIYSSEYSHRRPINVFFTRQGYKYYYKHYYNSTFVKTRWIIVWRFRTVKYLDMPICPKCRDFEACPFRNLTDYCDEVAFKTFLDNPHVVWLILVIAVWGILFNITWRRREKYLAWLWEIPLHDDKVTLRPDYWPRWRMQMRRFRCIKSLLTVLFRIAILSIFVLLYLCGVIPLLIYFHEVVNEMTLPLDEDWSFLHRGYVLLIFLGSVNAFLIILMERLCKMVSKYAVSLQNKRTEYKYEFALAFRWTGLSLLINFGLIYFFGLVKGLPYRYPSDPSRWYWYFGLGIMNCGMLSCIDEVFLVFVGTFVFKTAFEEFGEMFVPSRSEYNRFWWSSKSPCWEKEMKLYPLDDDFIMSQYQRLILQFAISTFFVAIFPLAPLCALLLNIWDIRHCAHLVLLRSRRPLMLKNWGLGAWQSVLNCLPYLAALSNIMLFAKNTSILDEMYHSKNFNSTRYFVDYSMGVFNTSDYHRETGPKSPAEMWSYFQRPGTTNLAVDYCLFPTKYNRYVTSYSEKRVLENAYVPTMGNWYIYWQQGLLVFVMMNLVLAAAALVTWAFRTHSAHIEEVREKEEIVRDYIIHTEEINKNK